MEAEHVAAQSQLHNLLQTHPAWSHRQLAETIGYSKAWVKKWRNGSKRQIPQTIA